MSSYSIVPLSSDPDQSLSITLPINNKNIRLNLRVRYNTEMQYWYMTISDANNNILIDSLPLLTGQYPSADLLGQYSYLQIGSATLIKTGNVSMENPDDTNLGTDFVLAWGDNT